MELLLVDLHLFLLCTLLSTVGAVHVVGEGLIVRGLLGNLAEGWDERILRAFVSIWQATVLRIGELIAAIIGKRLLDAVLCLTTRRTLTHVAFSIRGHSSDHTSALRILQVQAIGGGKRPRRLIRHFELTTLLIQIKHCLLLVRAPARKVRSIVRFDATVILVV